MAAPTARSCGRWLGSCTERYPATRHLFPQLFPTVDMNLCTPPSVGPDLFKAPATKHPNEGLPGGRPFAVASDLASKLLERLKPPDPDRLRRERWSAQMMVIEDREGRYTAARREFWSAVTGAIIVDARQGRLPAARSDR